MSQRRRDALEHFERATERPMLVLALAMVPLLVLPEVADLSPGARLAVAIVDGAIWVAFAVQYAVRLALSTARWQFVRREWLDLLIVVLPFLRPLRVLRLGAFMGEVFHEGGRLLTRHRLHYTLGVVALVVIGAAAAIVELERQASTATIRTFGDGLWWAVTTMSTVGYGDYSPKTSTGRALAAALMFTGIALFGVVTANVAALFLEHGAQEQDERLDDVVARLERIEAAVIAAATPDEGVT